ncbi:MAG TPA: S53 family peptidase [Pseudonocardiaceae bacterium]|nr:S53 family peptidase [Pseudonocardiaceae bacterium]
MAGGLASAIPAAAAGSTAIPQSHPAWATPQAKVATTSAAAQVGFQVYLNTPNEAAAEAYAASVSNPNSADYKHYLTPAQVKAQFAPSDATVSSVRNWLTAAGFSVGSVPSNNAYVPATGTSAQINKAFSVSLGEYKVNGTTLRSTDTNLSLPASLAPSVLGVLGIDQSAAVAVPNHTTGDATDDATSSRTKVISNASSNKPAVVAPPAGFRNAQPCGAYYGQKIDTTDPAYDGQQLPYAPCGYTPPQIRSADGLAQPVSAGIDGRGQTVAIVDAFGSPTLYSDAAQYARNNDPSHPLRASQFSENVAPPTPGQEDPSQCDAAGWYGEQSLDVEAVHATAPGAHILFEGAADCQDDSLDAALNNVVAGHLANIVSNSYLDLGEDLPAADVQAFNQIAVQAVVEGIGLYFSSGDDGDDALVNGGVPAANFSGTDPWVTAVGGTSEGIGRNGQKVVEAGWETAKSSLTNGAWGPTTYDYGSGGGTSVLFTEPWYQKGVVPNSLAKEYQTGKNLGRVVPDISEDADPTTGFLIGITQTFPDGVYYDQYRIGGTSLAAPLLAGTMADSDQLVGFHHGFINPIIYQFSSRTPAVTDVAPVHAAGLVRVDYANSIDASDGLITSVRTFGDQTTTLHTTKGYDNVTGLGTTNGWLFLGLS